MDKVLVTGASGYIALHCISELLKKGYSVKGSLRNLDREEEVRSSIKKEVADAKSAGSPAYSGTRIYIYTLNIYIYIFSRSSELHKTSNGIT